MKKTRMEKGITLTALIITIVVLLILAVVAINSIVNEKLIAHAENAAKTYNNSVRNEQTMLNEYLNHLNNGISGSGNGSEDGSGDGSGDDTVATISITIYSLDGVTRETYTVPKGTTYRQWIENYSPTWGGTAISIDADGLFVCGPELGSTGAFPSLDSPIPEDFTFSWT